MRHTLLHIHVPLFWAGMGMRHTLLCWEWDILWHSGGTKQSSGGACKWCSQKVSPAQVPQGPCQEASTSGGRGAGLPGEENQVSQPKENEPRGQENHWIMSPFDYRRTPHSFRFHFLLHWRRYYRSWQQYLRWCPFPLPHLSLPLSFSISSSPTCLPIFLLSFLYLPPHLPPFPTLFSYNSSSSSYLCYTSSPPLRATTSGSRCKPNWFLTTTMSSSFPWTSRPWKM